MRLFIHAAGLSSRSSAADRRYTGGYRICHKSIAEIKTEEYHESYNAIAAVRPATWRSPPARVIEMTAFS